MRKALAVAGLGVAAILGTALPASAAGGSSYSTPTTCVDYAGGYTFCYSFKGASNETATPSGVVNFHDNGIFSQSLTGPGQNFAYDLRYHVHSQFKQGEGHVASQHETYTQTFNGQTCTGSYDYHYANGNTQFDNVTPCT